MAYQTNDDPGRGRTGALEALLDAAQRSRHCRRLPDISEGSGTKDYEQIIGLAWRHQFNDDRSQFKREIRELQEHVCQRIIARLEQSE